MIGDKIKIEEEYFSLAKKIYAEIFKDESVNKDHFCISVAGESGSGKSVTAEVLRQFLGEKGIPTLTFHQDDYFKLPPRSNHTARLKDIQSVGLDEVNLKVLQENIDDFHHSKKMISKPVINYDENTITEELIDIQNIQILIVEGTYVNFLKNIDCKIFINRTYKETRQQRTERNREEMTDFIEEVLSLEHGIIQTQQSSADLIITNDYQIKQNLS